MLTIVLLVHVTFFLLESILWMQPGVYGILIAQLNNPVGLGDMEQALVLRNLFVNQGFYNLFLVCTGLYGIYLSIEGRYETGYLLLLVMSFSGTAAGVVLLLSTKAYILGILQAASSAMAVAGILPKFRLAANVGRH